MKQRRKNIVNLGIIGTGGYARTHVDGFAALQREGLARIVAAADVSGAALAAARQNPALADAALFDHHEKLLALEKLDAVIVSAPIPLHEEIALAAARRGVFVLLEKPAVPLMSQLERLIAADGQRRVLVGFQHIYSGALQLARKRLRAGKIGALRGVSVSGAWPRGDWYYNRSEWAAKLSWRGRVTLDGPCTNAFAHFIHNIMFLADSALPLRVWGELYRARQIDSYDTAALGGTLAGGAKFFAAFTHATETPCPVSTEITGARGTLRLNADGAQFIDETGRATAADDGRAAMHRAFLRFAGGDAAANLTPLSAMRGYTLATNLMFQSAGGIGAVLPPYSRLGRTEEHGQYPVISNIADILQIAAQTMRPLREAGADWAGEPLPVAAGDFSEPLLLKKFKLDKPRRKGKGEGKP